MKAKIRWAGIWLATLLLAMLMGMMVTRAGASGPVIWKQHCPRWHDVRQQPDVDGNGVHVLCVMQAEEVKR